MLHFKNFFVTLKSAGQRYKNIAAGGGVELIPYSEKFIRSFFRLFFNKLQLSSEAARQAMCLQPKAMRFIGQRYEVNLVIVSITHPYYCLGTII